MIEQVRKQNLEAQAIARAIIQARPQVLEQDKHFWLALRRACKQEDIARLHSLLEQAQTKLESVA